MIRILLLSVLAFSSFYSFGQVQPSVTVAPASQNVCTGFTAYFFATANGNNTISYNWQYWTGTVYADLVNNTIYSGVKTSQLGVKPTATGTSYYRCRIRDGNSTIDYYSPGFSTLSIVSPPSAPPTVTNGSACGPTSTVVLTASGAGANQTYQWYYGSKPINGETNSTYTTPSISTNTTYEVTINNGVCETSRVAVIAQIITPPTVPTITNGSNCGPGAVVLTAAGAPNGQYRWYAPAAKPPIAGETNSTYTTPVLTASATYNVSIYNGTCESSRVAINATINYVPATPTTTGSASCSPSTLVLNASGAIQGEQYRWYTVATGGTALQGQTTNSYTTPFLTTTTTYYVAVTNGICESPRASVTAQINTVTPPVTTGNSSCAPVALALSATGGSNGQYRWYTSTSAKTPITNETGSTFTTPVVSATTNYYVSIVIGSCESNRTIVTATINTPPTAPVAVNNSLCTIGRVSLGATGAKDGQYRWYTVSTGGQAIASEVNEKFLTPSLSATTTYYAAINDGTCESARTPVTATIGGNGCNNAPVIQAVPITTQIEGKVTLDLVKLVSDADKNLDLNTLKVVIQPASGAPASITANHELILDYSSTPFSGLEYLTIEVCDLLGACTQKQLSVEVAGDIIVYNAISPGNDGKNDIFKIQYIDILNNTQKNHVYIYSRWGDVIFDIADYDNDTKVFKGLNNSGNEIPSGTYFYKIEFGSGKASRSGYLTLKR